MLYFILYSYEPNTATTNRMMAYIRNLSKMGIETTVVFRVPNRNRDVFGVDLPNISFVYIWKRYFRTKFKILNVFLDKFYQRLIVWKINRDDKVYVYGQPEMLHCLVQRGELSVYHEITEHPYCIGNRNPLTTISWKTYFKDCAKLKGLFVISTELREFFVNQGVARKLVYIINMTVDASRFDGIHKETCEPYIAYCGIIFNDKDGVDTLIRAFALVKQKYPKYKLYIMGPTPRAKDTNTNLELIKSLGLEDSVVLKGSVSFLEMPQILVNSQMCVLSRPDNLRAKAGFPTKLGEYLLSKNPVVVTAVGDIPLFLKDQESAILVQSSDPVIFAEHMCWVIEHPDKSEEIGQNGARVANAYFNAKTETEKLVQYIFNE